ncbi:3-hydroxyacyl-CoA dehydrogenase NAD-binding domain-containing protein [Fulvivirga ulvae]|uniref:3-hydroxyacyl-CoA dehydrogenase family protein n=1 Tax=Fulvivirga ulvae TaxID=2904245 RepID=UPI001F394D30|nr:3-hydroxyacyl-CoA dehydrogenase NAD-binding domain-containing protein [Fulvivirga ulvae]UII31877.1 3-hydroxyacyl-CoA dehydrogenase NAD-binding domain-containing protein [Fulvivirga ulvae]
MKTIGVIGAGNIGLGVVCDLLFHGFNVVLVDNSDVALKKATQEISQTLRFAPIIDKRLKAISDESEIASRLNVTSELQDVKDCDFIIENITEKRELKKALYQRLDTICRDEICFAANTSCISITEIGGYTNRADQVIGIHFMNPSYLKLTVEVIRGDYTSEHTIGVTRALLEAMNKDLVLVNDLPGFVSNRISHLFMNEAAFVVQDQLAKPADVDKIFKECFGHKMGPLETADLIGLDTVMYSLEVLYESFQDPKYRCCPLLKKMVAGGKLGKKVKKGFYEYN